MLPSQHRLTRQELSQLFASAKKWYGQTVMCFYALEKPTTKAAVIIPKKTIKTAVKRHYYKRVLRNQLHGFLKQTVGVWVVVVLTKSGEKEVVIQGIAADLDRFFNQIT